MVAGRAHEMHQVLHLMKEKLLNAFFSLVGLSILIGCLGFMSGIVTLFIDVSALISVKWLILLLLLSFSTISILSKVLYDLSRETKPQPQLELPIKYDDADNIFVIKRNENFLNSILVGCYIMKDDVEVLAFLGAVNHVQDKVIQIKILRDYGKLDKIPTTKEQLSNIAIRAVVPFAALDQYHVAEVNNEQ